jgi:hypothetical protein
MANPTILGGSFQKHVPLRGVYRTNTLVELSARIIGSSSRLRGFGFVSENVGVDVTLSPGDFISVGAALDPGKPNRIAGIIVRTESNVTIDTSGFTDPTLWGFASDTAEATAVEFLVTEGGASPGGPSASQYAPLIFKSGGTWFQNQAIGNDSLASSGVLASGTGTVPAGTGNNVTIVHNLNLASYKVFLQPINQSAPTYDSGGVLTGVEAGVLSPLNKTVNTFDVQSSGSQATDFNWMVIA